MGFYSSIYPAIGRHLIYSTSRISIYEKLKNDGDSFLQKAMKGVFAGGFSQLIASPADLIKIKIQSNPSLSVKAVAKDVFKTGGVGGFFNGWQPNVMRACLVNVGELTTYGAKATNQKIFERIT